MLVHNITYSNQSVEIQMPQLPELECYCPWLSINMLLFLTPLFNVVSVSWVFREQAYNVLDSDV